MEGDVKEIFGVLMRAIDGDEISREEVEELAFEATGDLQLRLNKAYIQLLEFAYDRDARRQNPALDRETRAALQRTLDEIVRLCDATASSN